MNRTPANISSNTLLESSNEAPEIAALVHSIGFNLANAHTSCPWGASFYKTLHVDLERSFDSKNSCDIDGTWLGDFQERLVRVVSHACEEHPYLVKGPVAFHSSAWVAGNGEGQYSSTFKKNKRDCHVAAQTWTGNGYSTNEDFYVVEGETAFVGDGMGGHAFGEKIGAVFVAGARRRMQQETSLMKAYEDGVGEVNKLIGYLIGQGEEGRRIPGATLVGAQIGEKQIQILSLGDAKGLVMDLLDGRIVAETRDHTVFQDLLTLAKDKKRQDVVDQMLRYPPHHPMRHTVTRSIGIGGQDKFQDPEILTCRTPTQGRILLCSDGLTDLIPRRKILEVMQNSKSAELAVETLMDMSQSLQKKGVFLKNLSKNIETILFGKIAPRLETMNNDQILKYFMDVTNVPLQQILIPEEMRHFWSEFRLETALCTKDLTPTEDLIQLLKNHLAVYSRIFKLDNVTVVVMDTHLA